MPDSTGYTVVNPDDWSKSFAAKKASGSADFKVVSPDEWSTSYKSKLASIPPNGKIPKPGTAPNFSYDPAQVQKLEGGGLQKPLIDPIDALVFGGAGAVEGAGQAALKEGTSLLAPTALKEAARIGAGTVASMPIAQKGQELTHEAMQALPGEGPAAQIAKGVVEGAGSVAPFLAMGAAPSLKTAAAEKIAGADAIREAATGAGEKAAAQAAESQSAMMDAASKESAKTALDARAKLLAPEAKEETIANALDRSPDATQRAIYLPREGAANRRGQFLDTIYGPKNREGEELGNRFDKLFAPHVDKSADASPLGQVVQQEQQYAQANGVQFSKPVQKLLDEGSMLGSAHSVSPQDLGMDPKEWRALDPKMRETIQKRYQNIKPEAGFQAPETGTKIGQILGYRSKLGQAMAGAEGPDRAALSAMRDSVDDILGNSGVPGADKLRAQYSLFKKIYSPEFLRKAGKTIEPSDMAGDLFNEPQRIKGILDKAKPEELGTLRDLYGDAYNRGNIKMTPEQGPALAKMYPGTVLSNPKAWVFEKQTVDNLGQLFDSAPKARAKFMAAVNDAARSAQAADDTQFVKAALQESKKLGAIGDKIASAIKAGKTPAEQAKAAREAFKALNPEEAGQQAGVSAIQNFSPKDTGFRSSMKRYVQRSAAIGGLMALAGRPYFLEAGLAGGAMLAPAELIKNAYINSLKDPAEAAAFYRGIANPGTPSGMNAIANAVVKGAAGPMSTIEANPPEARKSIVAPAAESKRAEVIAGPKATPAKIDKVKDLDKDVRSGKTPDVHKDLSSGRISMGEVRKMLDGGKPSIASVFDGLTPDQSIDALAKASKQEKETYLPIIAQKIADSGTTMPKPEQQALLARLRQVMTEGAEG